MAEKAPELSHEELEAELVDLQHKLDRLRIMWEQYFLGIERQPPHTLQKDVFRLVNRLSTQQVKNALLKFRMQSLLQKFGSLRTYWMRTEREIEAGTYRRQRVRVQKHEQEHRTHGELSAGDIAAINAIRDRLGEEAAAEAERKRKAETEAGREAEEFLERTVGGLAGRKKRRTPTGAVATVGAHGDAATAGAPPPGTAPPASPAVGDPPAAGARAPEPAAPAGDAGGPRGMSADEIAKRAERLRAIREKLGGGGVATPPATAQAAPAAAVPQHAASRPAATAQGAAAPQSPPARPAPSVARPAAPAASPMASAPGTDAKARALYDRLVATKRQLNEATDTLSVDGVRRSLEQQAARVREKHNCRDVDFDVVVQNGRAYVKPIPIY